MPDPAAFALFRSAEAKPLVFPGVRELARRIHSERGGRGVELQEDDVGFRDQVRTVVAVHTLGLDGLRDRLIGYAVVDGAQPRIRLEAALDALQPRRVLQREPV